MAHIPQLFTALQIKDITFRNRIWMSPMCQYSSKNGHPTDWHFIHLGSRAVGGAGLIMVEATAVCPEGRITAEDSGIWSDEHIPGFKRITDFIKSQGAVAGMQIAHAGRKASTAVPWEGGGVVAATQGGWTTVAPSRIPFKEGNPEPKELSREDIKRSVDQFVAAAKRCLHAGFQVLELHMAHGYLLHEFLSPISNQRHDEYGGSLENRMRFPLEIAQAVRDTWPRNLPLFVRISTTDWAGGPDELQARKADELSELNSWHVFEAIIFAQKLKELGIDLIDCSTGGNLSNAKIPVGPSYQVPFAARIRQEAQIMTAAVGMITNPIQAEAILLEQQADAVFLARELLRNAYWPIQAAKTLGITVDKPNQYKLS